MADKIEKETPAPRRTILERAADESDKPYPREKRRRLLQFIAEESLNWWADCLEARRSKGINTAMNSYKDAVSEIDRIDNRASGFSVKADITVNGFRMQDCDFGDSGREGTDDDQVGESQEGERS